MESKKLWRIRYGLININNDHLSGQMITKQREKGKIFLTFKIGGRHKINRKTINNAYESAESMIEFIKNKYDIDINKDRYEFLISYFDSIHSFSQDTLISEDIINVLLKK